MVHDLEDSLQREKDREKEVSRGEWLTLRKEWEIETQELLDSIQEECNAVFSRGRLGLETPRTFIGKLPSPRSVVDNHDSVGENAESAFYALSISSDDAPARLELSLDQALEETEALVRGLLQNELKL